MLFLNPLLTHLDSSKAQHTAFQYLSISLALPQLTLLRSCSCICFSQRNTVRYPTKGSIAACGFAKEGFFPWIHYIMMHKSTNVAISFNLSHCMTEKELVYFVHCASHRLCINNQELSQLQHHPHEAGVPWQLWSGKSSTRPERRLQLPSHVSLPSISHHLSSKSTEVCCRTTHLKQAHPDWSTGLSRRHCPCLKSPLGNVSSSSASCNPTLLKPSGIFCFLFFGETCCHSPWALNTGVGAQGDVLILFVPGENKPAPNF